MPVETPPQARVTVWQSSTAAAKALVDAVRLALGVLRLTGISLIISLMAAAALLMTPQSFEALRVLAESAPGMRWRHAVLLELAVLLLAVMLWYCARVILDVVEANAFLDERRSRRWTAQWAPRLYGFVPILALGVALLRARDPYVGPTSGPYRFLLRAGWLTIVLAVVWLAAVWLRRRLLKPRELSDTARSTGRRPVSDLPPSTKRAFAGMLLLWAILFEAVWWTGGLIAVRLGPMLTILTCLATWVPIGTVAVYQGVRLDFPVVRTLLGVALLMAVTDCNDNHGVRALKATSAEPPSLRAHVDEWWSQRVDSQAFGQHYPVVIVAAEGGGIRNAYLTGTVLAAMHDACPRFTEHLLGVSAVSGGSVGAAVFTSLLADSPSAPDTTCELPHPRQMGALQTRVDRVLSRDLLSPVLASGLYLETVQKLWPWAIGHFDRARALERGIEEAYLGDTLRANRSAPAIAGAVSRLRAGGHLLPLLFLNTTSVESGQRMVIASVEPPAGRFHPSTLHDVAPGLAIRLSTAAGMSARFPFVTPEAVVRRDTGESRFVDGGYFDNSGVTTAIDLASAILDDDVAFFAAHHVHLEPVIIHVGIADATRASETRRVNQGINVGLHEVLAPVRTMLSTRAVRGNVVVSQLVEQAGLWYGGRVTVIDLDAQQGRVPFVLGWLMSESARRTMRDTLQPPPYCPDSEPSAKNPCTYGRVVAALKTIPPTR